MQPTSVCISKEVGASGHLLSPVQREGNASTFQLLPDSLQCLRTSRGACRRKLDGARNGLKARKGQQRLRPFDIAERRETSPREGVCHRHDRVEGALRIFESDPYLRTHDVAARIGRTEVEPGRSAFIAHGPKGCIEHMLVVGAGLSAHKFQTA